MKIKPGVNIAGLHPCMRVALTRAEKIFERHGYEMVITGGPEGSYAADSFHYYGFAVDLRSKHLSEGNKEDVLRQLAEQLADYEITLCCCDSVNEHFQIVCEKGFYRYLDNFWGR